ncbi:hypothetical protein MBLNU457_1526t1 [Dothideomycetes sp. NU457]
MNSTADDHERRRRSIEDVDHQRREWQFPEDDKSKDQESYKIGKYYVTRQALEDMIIKALDTGSLLGLHPAAHAKEDSIVIRSASLRFFEALRSLQDQGACRLRLDMLRRKSHFDGLPQRRGRLNIVMPGPLHDLSQDITFNIREQMLEQNFLPHALAERTIMGTGSTTMELGYDDRHRTVQPDSSLAIFHHEHIFLVTEITTTESVKHVTTKAEDYILGSGPGVSFVIMVFVEKAQVHVSQSRAPKLASDLSHDTASELSRDTASDLLHDTVSDLSRDTASDLLHNTTSDLSRDTESDLLHNRPSDLSRDMANNEDDIQGIVAKAQPQKTVDLKRLTDDDKVYVSVFGRGLEQESDSAGPFVVMTDLIDRVEVFPNPAPCSFAIRWVDVNQGDWDDYKSEHRLESDLPEPICTIDLSPLAEKARDSTSAPRLRRRTQRLPRKRRMPTSSPTEPQSSSSK